MLWGLPAARMEQADISPDKFQVLTTWFRRWRWNRLKNSAVIIFGIGLFLFVYFSPTWPDAVDPQGVHFTLTREGKASIGLFLLAAIWWVFEVMPMGVTGIAIGVLQALFAIRKPEIAFSNFFHPSVWFIFASLVVGKALSKSALTQRLAYRMLALAGERTMMIYLGCFALVALLTLMMSHTAVAATVFPLLMAVHSLYQEDNRPTRFGKGLFIGMAFSAAAASVVTLLGSARGMAAVGFFQEMAGQEISFVNFSFYLLPLGWGMILMIWLLMCFLYKPERGTIPGLKQRANDLVARLGPMSRTEWLTVSIVLAAIVLLCLRSLIPALHGIDGTAVLVLTTLLFFLLKILNMQDLEEIPWNVVLMIGGAMSLGFCLWQTGAAQWLAIRWLEICHYPHWFIFILSIGVGMLLITNVIMNVAAVAISMPIALVIASYLGVSPGVVFYVMLAAAAMPFLLLIGAAPNVIAYESRQFSPAEFFRAGFPASVLFLLVLVAFILIIWPLMGLSLLTGSP